ncbi:MAG: cell division protein FtsZ [Flavobacteriaceae bacterium]|nr:cell division protein FtsZ [Flavobacteriaceae bacterium]
MDFNNITFDLPKNKSANIKVIGVGGGGSNAVNYMFQQGITGVDFVVANTDAQALYNSPVPNKIQLGAAITEGLGAGANPQVGEQAALESLDDIKALLDTHTKMLFITAGMGGGTGTGAAPVIAGIAKEMGILTVGICTAPFYFEGKMRLEQAKAGIEKFRNNVDSLIIINNDKLRELYGNLSYKSGFAKADEVLATAAKGIAEVITHHYSTNIDLRDAKTVLANSGTAIMGSSRASGEQKAKKAIELALDSPLLNDNKISGAKNVLLLIVSGTDEITMDEIAIINEFIQNEAGHNANIIMGIGQDDDLGDSISVTVIATGFPQDQAGIHGKEEAPVIHRLEDEQPWDKNLSISNNKTPEVQKNELTEEENQAKISSHNLQMLDIETAEKDFYPENQKTEIQENEIIESKEEEYIEYHFDLDHDDFGNEPEEEQLNPKNVETTENLNDQKLTLFLDEDWEEEVDQPLAINENRGSAKKETAHDIKPAQENFTSFEIPKTQHNPSSSIQNEVIEEKVEQINLKEEAFEQPISEIVSQQIKERRERLKKFNYSFKSNLSAQEIDEAEKIPAYQRNKIELAEHKREKPGNYILDKDANNDLKIRPNNFLHDNVD